MPQQQLPVQPAGTPQWRRFRLTVACSFTNVGDVGPHLDRSLGIAASFALTETVGVRFRKTENQNESLTSGSGIRSPIDALIICFISTTSDAATFRLACGSVRGSPNHSTHGLLAVTPQVGQGTSRVACGTTRVFFISNRAEQDIRDRLFNFGQFRTAPTLTS